MDAERQIIGSLLIEQDRIDEMTSISSEMFCDPFLGQIFSIYAHADGREVNQLVLASRLKSSFMTEQQTMKYLADIASEHDSGISDKCCEEIILNNYKSRKVNEMISNSFVTPDNVDSFLEDLTAVSEIFQKQSESKTVCLSDLVSMRTAYFNDKRKNKYSMGFQKLDKAVGGLDDGDVIILAARPSVGKSALALQIGRKFGKDGYKVGYFNLEMGLKQMYERTLASASGIDMTRIRMATSFLNDEAQRFESGNDALSKEKNFFISTGMQTIQSIRAEQKKEKYDIIIIDYLQLITSSGNRGGNRAAEVGDISRGLKAIATDFNIPVIALSQLNRLSERTKDKEPNLADLRESGDIEQDASVVLMMWNANEEDLAEKMIKVEKSRNGFLDKMQLYFDGKHMRFMDEDEPTDFESVTDNEQLPW